MNYSHRSLLALLLACMTLPAAAHVGHGVAAQDFLAGFIHPFRGADHLLAMLAVGFWSASSPHRAWWTPAIFASLLLLGALLVTQGMDLPATEPMIATSVFVFGLLILAHTHETAPFNLMLIAGFALFHGAAHGVDLGAGMALVGMLVSSILLHILGHNARRLLQSHPLMSPRTVGAGIALAGAGLMLQLA